MRRLAAVACLVPGTALACVLLPSVVLTLPTGHYVAGAVAGGLTAAVAAMVPRACPRCMR